MLCLQEEHRARDLFYALWVPDLFMERVQNNGLWSLFCPNEAPGLADCWGEEFEKLYNQYEKEVSSLLTFRLFFACFTMFLLPIISLVFNQMHVYIGKSKEGCSGTESLV